MFKRYRRNRWLIFLVGIGFIIIVLSIVRFLPSIIEINSPRGRAFLTWATGDEHERAELITSQRETCPGAPFILPAEGYIGLLYADPRGPYSQASPHQGIDIFSNADPGVTPVYAAYDGYITREPDWKSTLIQRVPEDPLNPDRQVWLYYTHMANTEGTDFIQDVFPPGTREFFVKQGTLLGYTGNYNGNSLRGVWVHLHFSIVKDDGSGKYTNELEFNNTLDPSAYLGLPVHYNCAPADSFGAICEIDPVCGS